MRFSRRPIHLCLAGFAAVWAAGCSLALEFEDECVSTADCAKRGAGLVCSSGLCVTGDTTDAAPASLLGATCDTVFGPDGPEAFDGDAIRFGALIPRTGPLDLLGGFLDQALELAVDKINSSGGINGRQLTIVSCDSGTDGAKAVAAARHLVDSAKVTAIIGEVSSELTIFVFNEVAKPKGVLMLSPAASAPIVSDILDDGLLWRVAPSSARLGAALGHLLASLPKARTAVVSRDDPWGDGTRSALSEVYCGGQSCPEAEFMSRSYADATIGDDFASIFEDFAKFGPERVVLISYVQDGIAFANLAAENGIRQFYFADGARDVSFFEKVTNEELLCRALGTSIVPPAGAVYDNFRTLFEARWGRAPVPYTSNIFDCVYLLAYATLAAGGSGQPTGAQLAQALPRLTQGETVEVERQWNRGVKLLVENPDSTFDLVGASGSLDFDPQTGDVAGDVELWRFNLQTQAPESLGVVYTAAEEYVAPTLPSPEEGPCTPASAEQQPGEAGDGDDGASGSSN